MASLLEELEELKMPPIVEIEVSRRCDHDCFNINCSARSIWRFSGIEPLEADADDLFLIHHCGGECEDKECWEDGEDYKECWEDGED